MGRTTVQVIDTFAHLTQLPAHRRIDLHSNGGGKKGVVLADLAAKRTATFGGLLSSIKTTTVVTNLRVCLPTAETTAHNLLFQVRLPEQQSISI